MPETLTGLWKQRLRWAQGGAEVFLKNIRISGWGVTADVALIAEFSSKFGISIFDIFICVAVCSFPGGLNVPQIFPPPSLDSTGHCLLVTVLD